MDRIDADKTKATKKEKLQRIFGRRIAVLYSLVTGAIAGGPVGAAIGSEAGGDAYDLCVTNPAQERLQQWIDEITRVANDMIAARVIGDAESPEGQNFLAVVTACASDAAFPFIPEKQKAYKSLLKSSASSSSEIDAEEIEHMVETLRRTTGIHYAILQSINDHGQPLERMKLPSKFPVAHPKYAERRDLVKRALNDLDYLGLTDFVWVYTNTRTGHITLNQPPKPIGPQACPWAAKSCRVISKFGECFCKFALQGV